VRVRISGYTHGRYPSRHSPDGTTNAKKYKILIWKTTTTRNANQNPNPNTEA